ncbi:hypothetical protein IEO21_07545 [Rhodonia placenta]|uniref:Uncharacterized protein n=1 Tax=Rhodonia placenta TaxID=104341 RepID=A0A8H7U076_9APHY|nr:hypothetical protein IEO21_07545 [Postia placenta]
MLLSIPHRSRFPIDPGVAITVLDHALNIKMTYGAVMLSFLASLGLRVRGLTANAKGAPALYNTCYMQMLTRGLNMQLLYDISVSRVMYRSATCGKRATRTPFAVRNAYARRTLCSLIGGRWVRFGTGETFAPIGRRTRSVVVTMVLGYVWYRTACALMRKAEDQDMGIQDALPRSEGGASSTREWAFGMGAVRPPYLPLLDATYSVRLELNRRTGIARCESSFRTFVSKMQNSPSNNLPERALSTAGAPNVQRAGADDRERGSAGMDEGEIVEMDGWTIPHPRMRAPPSVVRAPVTDAVASPEPVPDAVVIPEPATDTVASPEPVANTVASPEPDKKRKSRNRCASQRSAAARRRRAEVAARVTELDNMIDDVHTGMERSREPEGSARRQRAQEWVDDESEDDAAGVEVHGVMRLERNSVTGSPVPVLGKRRLVPYVDIVLQPNRRAKKAVTATEPADELSHTKALKRAMFDMAAKKNAALKAKQHSEVPVHQRRRWNAEAKAATAVENRQRPPKVNHKAKKILHGNVRRNWHKNHFQQQNKVVIMGKRTPKEEIGLLQRGILLIVSQ